MAKQPFFFFLAHLHKITVNGVHSNDYWQGCFHLYLWRKISSLPPHIFLSLPPCNSSGCSCVNRADKIQYGLLRIWHCAFPKTFKRALATTLFIIFTYCLVKAGKGKFNFKDEFNKIEKISLFNSSILAGTEYMKSTGQRHISTTNNTDGIACVNIEN